MSAKKSMPVARNMVTVHRDTDADGNISAWYTLSPGYDGPDVTVDVDDTYGGGSFTVPESEDEHIYFIVGPVAMGVYVPEGANTVARINCAGGPGR